MSAPRNCLILGSGRSGTSMLAGSLDGAGYYMGDSLHPARAANPRGFFEDKEVNTINESLIASVVPARPAGSLGRLFRSRPTTGQRWLGRVPVGTTIVAGTEIDARIAAQTARTPYCFKDPRFCYTLPAWRAHLNDPVFLCIFREPARTAQSIVKECRDARYLRDLSMTFSRALEVWTLMYRHVLEIHRHEGQWVFVHFDQLLDGTALSTIGDVLGVAPDTGFPEPSLKRSPDDGDAGSEAMGIYRELCELAGAAT